MKKRRKLRQCSNCNTQLNVQDNFCPNCGQENHERTFSLRELWDDFIGSMFNFDGKVFTTFKMIFLRPGKVPKDIIAGRKIRYVPTIRFYFFVSFIYFLILNFGVDLMMQSNESKRIISEVTKMSYEKKLPIDKASYQLYKDSSDIALYKLALRITDTLPKPPLKKDKLMRLEDINAIDTIYLMNNDSATIGTDFTFSTKGISYNIEDENKISPQQIIYKINPTYDSVNISDYMISKRDLILLHNDRDSIHNYANELDNNLGFLDRASLKTHIEATVVLRHGSKTEIKNYVNKFLKKNLSNFSLALLIIMPLSALILYLFYFYIQPKLVPHIIFTIHLHTVMLILLSLLFAIVTGQFVVNIILNEAVWNLIILILLIYSSVYFVYALKRFYTTTWIMAIFKSLIISSIYTILLIAIAIGVFMISIL